MHRGPSSSPSRLGFYKGTYYGDCDTFETAVTMQARGAQPVPKDRKECVPVAILGTSGSLLDS